MQTKRPTSCREYIEENDSEEEEESVEEKSVAGEETERDEFDDIAETIQYRNLQKEETSILGNRRENILSNFPEKNQLSGYKTKKSIHAFAFMISTNYDSSIVSNRLIK